MGAKGLGIPQEELYRFLSEWELWIYQLSILAVLALFTFVIDRFTLHDMGLGRRPRGPLHLLYGLFLGAALISLGLLIMQVAGWASITFSSPAAPGAVALARGALFFTLVGLSEELLFRAYFFNNFTGRLANGVLISSLFFAAMHLFNPNISVIGFINIFIAGVLFACTYLWSGSLLLPIGIHITWNYVMGYIFGLPVSGLTIDGLLQVEVTGPAWITGAQFGLEGGLLATLLLLLGFPLSLVYLRPCRSRIT